MAQTMSASDIDEKPSVSSISARRRMGVAPECISSTPQASSMTQLRAM